MKSALLISLAFHVVIGFAWFRIVKISQVKFIPRQVYTVNLVTPTRAAEPKKTDVAPEPPAPKPVVEEKEEMPPPPEKPKPKPKPKPKQEKPKVAEKKSVPSAETEKTADSQESMDEPVTTGDIMLDGQDFPFAYYLTTMRRKVAAFWRVPGTHSEPKYCRVYFQVQRSGAISSPSVETSSGNFLFDQAALRAVVEASPLPPLPGGFADDYLGVHFSFAYEPE